MAENERNDEVFEDASVDATPQNSSYQYGSEYHYQHQHDSHPVHQTQQVFINPHPPDFTYLTPYASSADLQHMTPGPLYEIHYHYNNQSLEQSEPHYPIIPPNYGYHPYNYLPIMQHPGHFFHHRFIAPIHPPPTSPPPTIFYPHYFHPQVASHCENNATHQTQPLSDEQEMSERTGEEEPMAQPYTVQEPESLRTSPAQSRTNVHTTDEISCQMRHNEPPFE